MTNFDNLTFFVLMKFITVVLYIWGLIHIVRKIFKGL